MRLTRTSCPERTRWSGGYRSLGSGAGRCVCVWPFVLRICANLSDSDQFVFLGRAKALCQASAMTTELPPNPSQFSHRTKQTLSPHQGEVRQLCVHKWGHSGHISLRSLSQPKEDMQHERETHSLSSLTLSPLSLTGTHTELPLTIQKTFTCSHTFTQSV